MKIKIERGDQDFEVFRNRDETLFVSAASDVPRFQSISNSCLKCFMKRVSPQLAHFFFFGFFFLSLHLYEDQRGLFLTKDFSGNCCYATAQYRARTRWKLERMTALFS